MNREIALTLALQIAGVGLLLICVANFIAPKKLRWTVNLEKTEVFFQQVFKVHTFYIVLTMLGMALACLVTTEELIAGESLLERGFVWFVAIFWGLRVLIHITYYENEVKRKHPWWNILFLAAFAYLAIVFTLIAIL